MASHLLSVNHISHPRTSTIQNASANSHQMTTPEKEVARRSGNYKPAICDDDFIQSLTSPYGEASFRNRAEDLKEHVRSLLEKKEVDASESIELIDTLQRLGLSYLFEDEIKIVLQNKHIDHKTKENDLHYTALKFRISRQHGFFIPQDEFTPFLDENAVFKEALGNDTRAILSLYDASYTSLEGETLLDDARDFATRHLRKALIKKNLSSELRELVERGLEFPNYWRSPRIEARWSIAMYENDEKKDAQLLELAKLDHNICQARHQTNIKELSRWWTERGLAQLVPFTRDRLPESFLWSATHIYDPKYSYAAQWLTMVYQFVATIDDIYDVYGTLEELELFTKAVERWDIGALDKLPAYMRPCYLALLNYNNEMGYTTLKLQGWNITPLLKKFWVDTCNSYLVEAKWFHKGYTPSFEEYMNNGYVSGAGPVVLATMFVLMNQEITEDRIPPLKDYQDIIYPTSHAARLQDDLGTSINELRRGDVQKAVQCYMHEKGVSEEVAKQNVKHMISDLWKKMNKYLVIGSVFPRDFVKSSMDAQRTLHWFYWIGDGYGFQRERTFDLFKRLVVEPIPLGSNIVQD